MKNKKIVLSIDNIIDEYRESIVKNLKKYYYEVDICTGSEPNKNEESIYFKILNKVTKNGKKNRILKKLYNKELNKYQENLIKKYKNYDEILIVGGITYSLEFVKKLKEKNNKIKITQYLWDKCNDEIAKELKIKYDKIYSFEKKDVEKYGFIFRTSFYIDEYKNQEKDIDCYYLGGLREERRYKYIDRLNNYCIKNSLKGVFKLFLKKRRDRDKYTNEDILTHKKITYKENIEFVKRAKTVIELNFFNQEGLTLRTFECIGSKTKLITENKDIKNYDFYSNKNIYILEKEEDIDNIPIEFFKEPYMELKDEIKDKYSLDGFLREVLEIEKPSN